MTEEVVLCRDKLSEISCVIKKLVHSGCSGVEIGQIRNIIDICQAGEKYVEHAFQKLIIYLKKDHSEIRLVVVSIFNHFFCSFDSFRVLFLNNSNIYLKYTLGEKCNQILPPPKAAAKLLIRSTIEHLNSWFLKYGKNYPKLNDIYNELKNDKCVDFDNLEIYDRKERSKREMAIAESLRINKSLLIKASAEIREMEDDIKNSLVSIQSCFDLLIEFPEQSGEEELLSSNCNSNDYFRLHGIFKPYQNIEINVDSDKVLEIKVNEENRDIIENAKEMYNLINKKYLPKVKAWAILISKVDSDDELFCRAKELENSLEAAVEKYEKIKYVDKSCVDDSVSTDSELEEVEPEIFPKEKHEKAEVENEIFKEIIKNEMDRPGCSKSIESYSERKKELLKVAPKLPYSTDLYNWEEKACSTQTLLPTATDGHRFWASSSVESIEVPAESANLRVIEFTGKFEPVMRACRAPLPSGKLCTRHDRVKCPFHGIIVPRNEKGEIVNEEDRERVKKSNPTKNVPDWQDPKLLADLKATTGLDLKIGKKKRKRNPALTDIKKEDSSYKRISKKVFNRASLKRVQKTLDSLDYKRHRDKFKDQFNYLH